mmetsp:Transcript_36553/g.93431  ORF Transcript_36553/g.93431 Transcript_36553/m.93431 type:complete len:246 (+) Transcript_36553:630-1367(+)
MRGRSSPARTRCPLSGSVGPLAPAVAAGPARGLAGRRAPSHLTRYGGGGAGGSSYSSMRASAGGAPAAPLASRPAGSTAGGAGGASSAAAGAPGGAVEVEQSWPRQPSSQTHTGWWQIWSSSGGAQLCGCASQLPCPVQTRPTSEVGHLDTYAARLKGASGGSLPVAAADTHSVQRPTHSPSSRLPLSRRHSSRDRRSCFCPPAMRMSCSRRVGCLGPRRPAVTPSSSSDGPSSASPASTSSTCE